MRYKNSFPERLSHRLIRATAILYVTATLIIALASYIFIYLNAIDDASAMLEKNLLEIQCMLTDVESAANSASGFIIKDASDEERLCSSVFNLVQSDTNIVSAAIGFEPFCFDKKTKFFCPSAFFGEGGTVDTSIMGSDDYDYHVMDWYVIPKYLKEGYWSEPTFNSDGSGRLVSSYSKPLFDADGNFFAVLRCDIDLEWLSDKIQELRPYENSLTILAGQNASIISHANKDMILSETLFSMILSNDSDPDIVDIARKMVSGESGYGQYRDKSGTGFIVYGPLKNGWSGAIICSNDDILYQARRMNAISLLVTIFVLLLLYYSGKKIVSHESRPITALAYSAMNIAQGNFSARIPDVQSEDELKRLHDSLSYLEESIDEYIHELRVTTSSNERYESELNIASAIQMQMLPKDYPQTPEVDLYATLHPAKEVGGDLYDFFVKDRMLYFAVGDVSGKGVPAALYMAITRSAFRFIAGLGLPVDGVVSKINNAFCDGNDSGMFVTMFVGRLNLDTLELEYCNAGHNPIIIVGPDGNAHYLHAKANMAAGLFENFPYTGEYLQIEKGSRLLIYTDGITEAENADGGQYGEDRLEAFACGENKDSRSADFIADLVTDIKKFTKGNPQNDDVTVMSIKVKA